MIVEFIIIIAFVIVLMIVLFLGHRQSKRIAKEMKEENEKFQKRWEDYKKEIEIRQKRKDKVKKAKRVQNLLSKKRMQTRRNRDVKKQ